MIVRGAGESHAPGALSTPGGKVEPTDGPTSALESALHREILEETGVRVDDDMTYVESGMFDMDDGRKALGVVFLCRYKSGRPNSANDEVESVLWMTPDDIRQHERARPWLRDTISKVEKLREQAGRRVIR